METLTEFWRDKENARRLIDLKIFLKKHGVFLEFMNALGEQEGLSLKDLIKVTDPGEEITGAFRWDEVDIKKWSKVNNQWRKHADNLS